MVAAALPDPKAYSAEMIAQLFTDRRTIELRLRDIKTTLGMDMVRCKSSDVVCEEIDIYSPDGIQSHACAYVSGFCGTSKAVMVYKLQFY